MTTRSRSDHVEITFHAIASKKFVENPSNNIYLRFALEEMKGFQTLWKTYPMQYDISPVPLAYNLFQWFFCYESCEKKNNMQKLNKKKKTIFY